MLRARRLAPPALTLAWAAHGSVNTRAARDRGDTTTWAIVCIRPWLLLSGSWHRTSGWLVAGLCCRRVCSEANTPTWPTSTAGAEGRWGMAWRPGGPTNLCRRAAPSPASDEVHAASVLGRLPTSAERDPQCARQAGIRSKVQSIGPTCGAEPSASQRPGPLARTRGRPYFPGRHRVWTISRDSSNLSCWLRAGPSRHLPNIAAGDPTQFSRGGQATSATARRLGSVAKTTASWGPIRVGNGTRR